MNKAGNRRLKTRHRSAKGDLFVELSCAAFFLTIFAIVAVHVGLIIFGAFLNDRACRDAARSAAQGSSQTQATSLAQTVLVSHKQTLGNYIASPVLTTPIVYNDYGGSPPTALSPYVQITTTTAVHLPIPFLNFFSAVFTEDKGLTFTATYTFPIVRIN